MTCLKCGIKRDLDRTVFLPVLGRVFRILSSKIAIRKIVKMISAAKIRSRLLSSNSIFIRDIYLLTQKRKEKLPIKKIKWI